MPNLSSAFRHIAVVAHPLLPSAISISQEVGEFLKERNVRVTNGILSDDCLRTEIAEGKYDIVIALGGDGTMLRAGHFCAPQNIPLLGINLGRFGFLTELGQKTWQEFLVRLLEGSYWLEKRMMLRVEQWQEEKKLGSWDVLNEVVVTRGQMIRPVHLTAEVDGQVLTTYVADALIAATPTGSTAYALAAGGPILAPELRNILLVPVAPHLSIDRAVVLAEHSTLCIHTHARTQAYFSTDGQMPIELNHRQHILVHASEFNTQFIRFQDPGYFYRNLTPHMNNNPSTGNSS